jgi:hypothetical protein
MIKVRYPRDLRILRQVPSIDLRRVIGGASEPAPPADAAGPMKESMPP